MGAESTPLLRHTRNGPIRQSHLECATANGRANRWDVWFVPGHCFSRSIGNSWRPGFIHPKFKKPLGVVSVHNCSLRRAIISEADRAHPLTRNSHHPRAAGGAMKKEKRVVRPSQLPRSISCCANVQESRWNWGSARSRELLPAAGDLGIREKRKAPGQEKRPGRPKRYATGDVAWVMHSEVDASHSH